MSIADKKQQTLMKRRKRAIILSAIAVLILAIALSFVLEYVETITFTDPADQTDYYVRKKDGVYGLYDADKNLLPTDAEYGYYVTAAGTLVKVDAETGEAEPFAILDTEGNEVQGFNSRIMMFPNVAKKDILSIEIHNDTGSYTFVRYNTETGKVDKSSDFVIKSSPLTIYDEELFGKMYVTAGYTLTLQKLDKPMKDENGNLVLSEYGLVPETRYKTVDEDGEELDEPVEYQYEPAYYILTDVNGVRHKVIVGDMLVTQGGYYVQYVEMNGETETKRNAVYVMDTDIGKTILAPVEDYVTPLLSYPMKMTDYIDVEDFTISKMKEGATPGATDLYERIISFTYIDLSLRENSIAASFPYELDMELNGYYASDENIAECLESMYKPSLKEACVLSPSLKELSDYGLYKEVTNEAGEISYVPFAPYTISFKYDMTDDNNEYVDTIHQLIMISEKNEDGNYYAYTAVSAVVEENGEETYEPMFTYDMIVEVEGHTLEFLDWDRVDWISKSYIQTNIAYVDKITLSSPNYSASFELDNSMSDSSSATNSTHLSVNATDSRGNSVSTLGKLTITDVNGYRWEISANNISVYNAVTGKEHNVASSVRYYEYNALGDQVMCRTGVIDCDGYDVEVTANAVNILYDGSATVKESIVRYHTSLFRDYFGMLAYSTIMDSYTLTEEEEQALLADPSKWLLTLTVTTKDSDGTLETKTYSFYQVASRKAYITINGNGGFYVQKNRMDKFITDAQKFFDLEIIDPTAKT